MKLNDTYKNGQIQAEQKGEVRIVYFKNGRIKAQGPFIDEQMQGDWLFYRESGELWSEGHFQDNLQQGEWKRYDRQGNMEYHAIFEAGKRIKKLL